MALQTTITAVHAHLIWSTLVHKGRKTAPEFQPTQNRLFRTLIFGGYEAMLPKYLTNGRG